MWGQLLDNPRCVLEEPRESPHTETMYNSCASSAVRSFFSRRHSHKMSHARVVARPAISRAITSKRRPGAVAQPGERCVRNAEVGGSSPLRSTLPVAQSSCWPVSLCGVKIFTDESFWATKRHKKDVLDRCQFFVFFCDSLWPFFHGKLVDSNPHGRSNRRSLHQQTVIRRFREENRAIMLSPVSLSGHPDLKVMGLAPMAVSPQHQRQGIGSALIRAGLQRAARLDFAAVVVLGHPVYYPRFGFSPSSRFGIDCAYEVPDEAFMAIELRPGALDGRAGRVTYHAAFGDV